MQQTKIFLYKKNITINKLCTWKNYYVKNIKTLIKFLKHTFYKHISRNKYIMLLTIL